MNTRSYLIFLSFILSASLLFSQNPTKLITDGWAVSDGIVNTIHDDGNHVYAGGTFTQVAKTNIRGFQMSDSNGAPFGNNLNINGEVLCSAPDGSGGWFIGGDFSAVNDIPRVRLAHILSNGDLDLSWNASANNSVICMLRVGTVLYIGGSFSQINSTSRNHIASISTTNGTLTTNIQNIETNLQVRTMKLDGSLLYIGGQFTSVNAPTAFPRGRLAILNISTNPATLSNLYSPGVPDGQINAIDISPNYIYVAGTFTQVNSNLNFRNLCRFNRSTELLDGGFQPAPNDIVHTMIVDPFNDYCWVGGNFTTISGQARVRLAFLQTNGSVFPFRCDANNSVLTMRLAGAGNIAVAGSFTSIGANNSIAPTQNLQNTYFTIINATSGVISTTFNHPVLNGFVRTIDQASGKFFIGGGNFTLSHITSRNRIARFVRSNMSLDVNWNFTGFNNTVNSIDSDNNFIYVGGNFTSVSGNASFNRLVRIDKAAATLNTAWNPNPNGNVNKVLLADSDVYTGGEFATIGGGSSGLLAKLNNTNGQLASGWNNGLSLVAGTGTPSVTNIEINTAKNRMVVVGNYNRVNGITRNYGAIFDIAQNGVVTLNPYVMSITGGLGLALSIDNEDLYVGGSFGAAQSQLRDRAAKYSIGSTIDLSTIWTPSFSHPTNNPTFINNTAIYNNHLYAGGNFSTISGNPAFFFIGRVNKNTGAPDGGWQPQLLPNTSQVNAVHIKGQRLYFGGNFTNVDNDFSHGRIAVYELPCFNATISQQPQAATICVGQNTQLQVQASGVNLSYQWRKNGTPISGATNSILFLNNVTSGDGGSYDVVITSNCNTITSSAAIVTVNNPLVSVTSQPAPINGCVGSNITLSAGLNPAPASVQWFLNNNPISGATTNPFTINNAGINNTGNYHVVATDANGCTTTSNSAIIQLTGEIHKYLFNSGSGTDAIGTNNITFTGGAWSQVQNRLNENFSALQGSFVNGRVMDVSDIFGTQLSVSMWLNRTASSGFTTLIASDNTANPVHLLIDNNTGRIGIFNGSFITSNANGVITTGVWKHVVYTTNGTNNKIYVDGILVLDTNSGINTATVPISRFGNNSNINVGQGYLGRIDDIIVFNKAIDINEVEAIRGFQMPNPTSVNLLCSGTNIVLRSKIYNAPAGTTYQWYHNNNPVSGANADTLVLNNTNSSNSGTYYLTANYNCINLQSINIPVTIGNSVTPTITTQPQSHIACVGSSHTFTVGTTGDVNGYQWFKVGFGLIGTANILTFNNISVNDTGSYYVLIQHDCGSPIMSDTFALTITQAPLITQQPQSTVTGCTGSSATFTVTANGSGLSYQWRKNGNPISGANASSYTISNLITADAGNYDVVITNNCGTVTSSVSNLTIIQGPVINTQPVGATVCQGSSYSLSVNVSGSGLTYQWRKNGVNIPGATNTTLNFSNIQLSDNGNYDVVITSSSCGNITSSSATITVNPENTITTQPSNATLCAGTNGQLIVVANGVNLTYQWFRNGSPISGATSATLNLNNVTTLNAGNYTVEVSGTCGPPVVSNIAVITVESAPIYITQPSSGTYCQGDEMILQAQFSNNVNDYQWWHNGNQVQFTSNPSYTVSSVTSANQGTYVLVAYNNCGGTQSQIVNITVNPTFTNNIQAQICYGETYTVGTTTYTQSGNYTNTLSTINGCDSIIQLNLTIDAEISTSLQAVICDGDVYSFGNQNLTSGGTFTDILTAVSGCDSTVTLNLTVIDPNTVFTSNASVCFGQSYQFETLTLTQSGQYTQTFTSVAGCDSVVQLTLTIENEILNTVSVNGSVLSANQTNASYQWIDCDNGNTPMSGATAQSFTPSISGNYAVIISIGNCSVTSNCTNVNISNTGINEDKKSAIAVYPNPAKDMVVIDGLTANSKIVIIDAIGKIVFSEQNNTTQLQINTESFNNGIYFIKIENTGSNTIKKLVVNK